MAVLLLSASLAPLNVISRRRLCILLSKQRVALLSEDAEVEALTAFDERRLPQGIVMVRLLRSVHVPRRMLRPSRRNLLLRDDHECQYCGVLGSASELTIDHVVPVSRGGDPSTWENQVVACKRCNWRKASSLPHEVGMSLRRRPAPLTQEYASVIFLRHPELKLAYEELCA